MNRRRLIGCTACAASTLALGAAASQPTGPIPPCDGPPWPSPAALGQAPRVAAWAGEASRRWVPPACVGWSGAGARSLVAVSGRARVPGGIDAVLGRFGAISRLVGVRYWSVSAQVWAPLVTAAHAVADADASGGSRADYAPAEMREGRSLLFSQTDNDAGALVYRMRVVSRTPTRAVITSENLGTIRRFMLPLFGAGELQSVYDLELTAEPDVWLLYILIRSASGASALTDGHEASTINRAVALYRHVAEIPTDREPPAAPR